MESLGTLAYDDIVEVAKLGQTIMQGGYIKTELIHAAMLSAFSAYLGNVRVGGSGNGSGVLDLYDENDILKIKLNNKGVNLYDDTQIISENGAINSFEFMTDWQWVGMSYQYPSGGRPNITIPVPSNFVIQSAILETLVKSKYMHGFSGHSSGYYFPTGMKIYQASNDNDMHLDWGYSTEYFDVIGNSGRIDRTSALWGTSSWSPSGTSTIAIKTADIKDLLTVGGKQTFYIESSESYPTDDFFRGSHVKLIATIKGFQR